MYQIHDVVVHPSEGVCEICDVRTEKFGAAPERYYVLRPVYATVKTTIYVPLARESDQLRPLLSPPEIDDLLCRTLQIPSVWVQDAQQRAQAFSALLDAEDYPRVVRMIMELWEHAEQARQNGKKPRQSDERLLQLAQQRIHREFGSSLGLDEAQTVAYIRAHLTDQTSSNAGANA